MYCTVIDFETTGSVEGYPNEPWQIGMTHFADARVQPEYRCARYLRIAADRPFNVYAPGRHARIRDQLAEAPTLPKLWPELAPWLTGRPLAAHNAATEQNVLHQAFPMHAFGPWIDTLRLARIAYPDASSHKLEDLAERLGLHARAAAVCPDAGPHDALYDAVCCGLLLEHLLAQPGWRDAALDQLATP